MHTLIQLEPHFFRKKTNYNNSLQHSYSLLDISRNFSTRQKQHSISYYQNLFQIDHWNRIKCMESPYIRTLTRDHWRIPLVREQRLLLLLLWTPSSSPYVVDDVRSSCPLLKGGVGGYGELEVNKKTITTLILSLFLFRIICRQNYSPKINDCYNLFTHFKGNL